MRIILSPEVLQRSIASHFTEFMRDTITRFANPKVLTYPGDAKAVAYIPYLDFEREADMLREPANHAIQDYNNRETNIQFWDSSFGMELGWPRATNCSHDVCPFQNPSLNNNNKLYIVDISASTHDIFRI